MFNAYVPIRLPASRASWVGPLGGALALHGLVAGALLAAWPEVRDLLVEAVPMEVRLVEERKVAEPAEPPPPPKRPEPPPRAVEPMPVAPLPVPVAAPSAMPAVMATAAPANVPMVEPPASVVPGPVPAPPAPAPEVLVEARFDADYLSNPKPPYPMASRRLGEEGVVRLRVHVGPDGQALKVEIRSSSGFTRLDQSALDTVARWHFVPARRGAVPVASWVVVPIVFSLS